MVDFTRSHVAIRSSETTPYFRRQAASVFQQRHSLISISTCISEKLRHRFLPNTGFIDSDRAWRTKAHLKGCNRCTEATHFEPCPPSTSARSLAPALCFAAFRSCSCCRGHTTDALTLSLGFMAPYAPRASPIGPSARTTPPCSGTQYYSSCTFPDYSSPPRRLTSASQLIGISSYCHATSFHLPLFHHHGLQRRRFRCGCLVREICPFSSCFSDGATLGAAV